MVTRLPPRSRRRQLEGLRPLNSDLVAAGQRRLQILQDLRLKRKINDEAARFQEQQQSSPFGVPFTPSPAQPNILSDLEVPQPTARPQPITQTARPQPITQTALPNLATLSQGTTAQPQRIGLLRQQQPPDDPVLPITQALSRAFSPGQDSSAFEGLDRFLTGAGLGIAGFQRREQGPEDPEQLRAMQIDLFERLPYVTNAEAGVEAGENDYAAVYRKFLDAYDDMPTFQSLAENERRIYLDARTREVIDPTVPDDPGPFLEAVPGIGFLGGTVGRAGARAVGGAAARTAAQTERAIATTSRNLGLAAEAQRRSTQALQPSRVTEPIEDLRRRVESARSTVDQEDIARRSIQLGRQQQEQLTNDLRQAEEALTQAEEAAPALERYRTLLGAEEAEAAQGSFTQTLRRLTDENGSIVLHHELRLLASEVPITRSELALPSGEVRQLRDAAQALEYHNALTARTTQRSRGTAVRAQLINAAGPDGGEAYVLRLTADTDPASVAYANHRGDVFAMESALEQANQELARIRVLEEEGARVADRWKAQAERVANGAQERLAQLIRLEESIIQRSADVDARAVGRPERVSQLAEIIGQLEDVPTPAAARQTVEQLGDRLGTAQGLEQVGQLQLEAISPEARRATQTLGRDEALLARREAEQVFPIFAPEDRVTLMLPAGRRRPRLMLADRKTRQAIEAARSRNPQTQTEVVIENNQGYPDAAADAQPASVVLPPADASEASHTFLADRYDRIGEAVNARMVNILGDNNTLDPVEAFARAYREEFAALGMPDAPLPPHLEALVNANSQDPVVKMSQVTGYPGQEVHKAAIGEYAGAVNRMNIAEDQFRRFMDDALQEAEMPGRTVGGRFIPEASDEVRQLLIAAIDGAPIEQAPAKYRRVLQMARDHLKIEEQRTFADDPSFINAMKAHPEYFPGFWRYKGKKTPLTDADVGRLGSRPGFKFPRVDAPYAEKLAAMEKVGVEPLSWNIGEMAVVRVLQGTRFRETKVMLSKLSDHGLALPAVSAPEKGWKIPQNVGPMFSGKVVYPRKDGTLARGHAIATPNRVADLLENVFAPDPSFVIANNIDVARATRRTSVALKLANLFVSFFQHIDIATRPFDTFILGPIQTRSLRPWLQIPELVANTARATLSPGFRARRTAQLVDETPWYDDFPITNKMLTETGFSPTDVSVIGGPIKGAIDDIAEGAPEGIRDNIRNLVNGANRYWQGGLFEGLTRELQLFHARNVLAPHYRRRFPSWTPQQVAAKVAEDEAIVFSSLQVWQSVLNSRGLRYALQQLIFSTNENEAFLRYYFRIAPARVGRGGTLGVRATPSGSIYAQMFLARSAFLMATAAVLHRFNTGEGLNPVRRFETGENLPLDRLVPFTTGSPNSFWPGGFDMSPDLMSIDLPFRGRNGVRLRLDMLGQHDTVLRIVMNPPGALRARLNIIPNASWTQVTGQDFFGTHLVSENPDRGAAILETIRNRALRGAVDLVVPFGLANVPGLREETRIGEVGAGFQYVGINVRAERTDQLLNRHALNVYGQPFDELSTVQQRTIQTAPQVAQELELRDQEARDRKRPYAVRRQEFEEAQGTMQESQRANWNAFNEGMARPDGTIRAMSGRDFLEAVYDGIKQFSNTADMIDAKYSQYTREKTPPRNANERALFQYRDLIREAGTIPNNFDYDYYSERLYRLKNTVWTPEQARYVDDNTGFLEHIPEVKDYFAMREQYQPFFDLDRQVITDQRHLQLFRQWQKLQGPSENIPEVQARELFAARNPGVPFMEYSRILDGVRNEIRLQDQTMDAFLIMFYDYIPLPGSINETRYLEISPYQRNLRRTGGR